MRRKLLRVGIIWRLLIILILALCLVPIGSSPAAAQSVEDLFNITYEVSLSKTEISGSEIFSATIQGEARCKEDLEFPYSWVSEARITGRVTATHQASGAKVTLKSSYTVTIDPFPTKKGETSQSSVVVSLRFPGTSQSGTYSLAGELIEAKVKVDILNAWVPVTSHLPSSQAMGSVTYVAGDGDGDGGFEPDNGLSDYIDENGVFIQDITAKSEDGKCELTIDKDTIGLTEDGEPLSELNIVEEVNPPAPPADASIIGLVYNLGPDGATFDPPITLAFTYDESLIPEDVAEEDLIIALWDEESEEWVNLVCVVDPETNTITAEISHFTPFTVLGYTHSAVFVVSDLFITPDEVNIGEEVTISVLIANVGNLTGSYEVTLKIDEVVVATEEVTLAGGANDTVTFKISKNAADTYSVDIGGLSGSFEVIKPADVPEPESTPASPSTPEATHTPSAKPINWPVLYGVIAAVVVVGLSIFFLVRRRAH